jgi:hypothetical protein
MEDDEESDIEVIADEELDFTEQIEDDSDIPVEILAGHITSGLETIKDGFELDSDGSVVRKSAIEDADLEVEEEDVVLGRGRRNKKVPKRFGGVGVWDQE